MSLHTCSPILYIQPNVKTDPILTVSAPPENAISFHSGKDEILKITEDGFYVRGKKVPVDEEEGLAVYRAFKQFLVHHALTKEW